MLGVDWSQRDKIQERRTLVVAEPYHWVRHPMYATLFLWALAYFFISANWLVGVEKAALVETFGDAYRAYMLHIG